MRIDKPDDMAVVARRGEGRGGASPSLSLLLAFELRPDDRATTLPESELWERATRALGPTAALDAGVPERGAQVLVHGQAWPGPDQPTARHLQVALRVSAPAAANGGASGPPWIDKRLDVYGERELDAWLGPGTAQEFDSMPLDLSRAFGGPGHASNPQGRGAAAVASPDGTRWPMPNVEYPHDPLRRRGQDVEPATLGPLGPMQRALPPDQLEAATREWLLAWPHGAPPARQQAHAPADQWLAQDLRGDEQVELLHLHPRYPRLRCQLPGLRPRCLWGAAPARQAGPSGWQELALRGHTLWLLPQAMMGIVLYRAEVPAGFDPGATDAWLLTGWDALAQAPRTADEFARAWRTRHVDEATAPPVDAPAAAGGTGATAKPRPDKPPAADTLAQARDDVIRELRERGWNQARIDELQRSNWLPQPPAGEASLAELLEQLQAETDALRARHAIGDAEIRRFVEIAQRELPSPTGPASTRAGLAQALRELNQHTEQALRQAGLSEAQAAQALEQRHPELARALLGLLPPRPAADAVAQSASTPAAAAPSQPPDPARDAPAAGSPPTRGEVEQWLRDGRSLRGCQLDGLDLSGLDFSGVDLRGVQACQTRFAGCRMQRARLDEAVLRDAELGAADLRGASLRDSSWARAHLQRACLADADCEGADFTQADLQKADLAGASLRNALFERTLLGDVTAARSDASNAQFAGCDLRGSDWQEAAAHASAWLECDLRHARMSRIAAHEINLEGSDASDADLSGADLRGSRATPDTRLQRASLAQADLRGACWEGAALEQADLRACRLDGADLSRVRAAQACLRAIHGSGLRLDDADLRGADLDHAKLLQASLAGADLRDASLVSTLCFGADLGDLRTGPDTLRRADLRRTVVCAAAATEAQR